MMMMMTVLQHSIGSETSKVDHSLQDYEALFQPLTYVEVPTELKLVSDMKPLEMTITIKEEKESTLLSV